MNQNKLALRHRDILAFALVLVLIALGVAHFLTIGHTVEPIEWVVLYVLVGFIGGLLFYLADPLHSQEFKWKDVVTLGGGAAVGASFMLLAKVLTPDSPTLVDHEYQAAVLPVHKSVVLGVGVPLKVLEVGSLTDNKLVELFLGIMSVVNSELGSNPSAANQKLFLQSFLQEIRLHLIKEVPSERLESLVDRFLKNEREKIDSDWRDIVNEHLEANCPDTRKECKITFNRIPYAVYSLGEDRNLVLGIAVPGTQIRTDSKNYEVVTFANPRRKYSEQLGLTTQMFEGIVLRRQE